ncbi:MAG TPA: DUF3473 domain-containing protein [archaeon]|nr:DUF3473 domain-containing protein [archaeon]
MINVITIDFEEYYQGILSIDPATYNSWPGRIEFMGEKVLLLLADFDITATFFVSGHVAQRYPGLVRRIHQAGHEIASHGFQHGLIYRMDPERFREDLLRASEAIVTCTGGSAPRGFRAPWWSIGKKNEWVWQILDSLGFYYDSSVYPIRMRYYGMPDTPRVSYRIPGTNLMEIPPATIEILNFRLSVAGGFYWRHYPLPFIRWGLRRINREGIPAVCMFHPWELDIEQPSINNISFEQRLIHFSGRRSLERKMRRLFAEFRFSSIREVFLPDSKESAGNKEE